MSLINHQFLIKDSTVLGINILICPINNRLLNKWKCDDYKNQNGQCCNRYRPCSFLELLKAICIAKVSECNHAHHAQSSTHALPVLLIFVFPEIAGIFIKEQVVYSLNDVPQNNALII